MSLLRPVLAILPLLWSLGGCASNSRTVDPPLKKPLVYSQDFYKQKILDPASLAIAANHFIRMGEKGAIQAMLDEAPTNQKNGEAEIELRRCLLIKLLFERKNPNFHGPAMGFFFYLPYPPTNSEGEKLNRIWPDLPLVKSQGVCFLVDENYIVITAGLRQQLPSMLERCSREARFRTEEYPVPNRAKAQAAFDALVKRLEWRRLIKKSPAHLEKNLRDAIAATPE